MIYCNIIGYQNPDLPAINSPNVYQKYKESATNHGFAIQSVADILKGDATIIINALEGLNVVILLDECIRSVQCRFLAVI